MFAFTLRQIEVFMAVYEMGSFRRAAEMLGISEAGVSMHMRLLEEQLGCELFERRRGAAISLSHEGVEFRDDAAAFCRAGRQLGDKYRRPAARQAKLRFYIGDHLMEDYVRPALPEFLHGNPDMEFTFLSNIPRHLVPRRLEAGELDGALLTVRSEEELPGSLLLSQVGSGIYGLPALRDTAEAQGLGAISFLMARQDVMGQKRALGRLGVSPVKVAGLYPYHDVGVRMALMGVGAMMTLDSIIASFDRNRALVKIRPMLTWERRMVLPAFLSTDQAARIRLFFDMALGGDGSEEQP